MLGGGGEGAKAYADGTCPLGFVVFDPDPPGYAAQRPTQGHHRAARPFPGPPGVAPWLHPAPMALGGPQAVATQPAWWRNPRPYAGGPDHPATPAAPERHQSTERLTTAALDGRSIGVRGAIAPRAAGPLHSIHRYRTRLGRLWLGVQLKPLPTAREPVSLWLKARQNIRNIQMYLFALTLYMVHVLVSLLTTLKIKS